MAQIMAPDRVKEYTPSQIKAAIEQSPKRAIEFIDVLEKNPELRNECVQIVANK